MGETTITCHHQVAGGIEVKHVSNPVNCQEFMLFSCIFSTWGYLMSNRSKYPLTLISASLCHVYSFDQYLHTLFYCLLYKQYRPIVKVMRSIQWYCFLVKKTDCGLYFITDVRSGPLAFMENTDRSQTFDILCISLCAILLIFTQIFWLSYLRF